jgi:glycosyltransferase involved in cell wall biosynthesis
MPFRIGRLAMAMTLEKMVRVVHLCQDRAERVGGSSVVAQELVTAQRALGVDSTLLFLYASNAEGRQMDPQTCAIRHKSRWTVGVPQLSRVLRSLNPDVIHHHHGLAWPWVAALNGSRVHITHGHLSAPAASVFSRAGLCAALAKRFSSGLIAISEPVAESWQAAGFSPKNIVLIPNGVNAERFRPASIRQIGALRERLNLPRDRTILLWIGRLDVETKGVDRLCEILRLLDPKYFVVIVGDGPGREYLRKEIAAPAVLGKARYVGSVADPTPYYQSADAFLFTSRREPMGLVILEAAATGLPIFAFPCEGGARDLLREVGATSTQSDNAAVLADAINEVSLVRRSSGEILAITSKYSWEACARHSLDVYANALRPSHAPLTFGIRS